MRLGRITGADEFASILRKGTQSRHHGIAVSFQLTDKAPRLGFAVGRSAGNAVQRNRFRRVVREFLRQQRLPTVDIVISLRTAIRPMTNTVIREAVTVLLKTQGWLP